MDALGQPKALCGPQLAATSSPSTLTPHSGWLRSFVQNNVTAEFYAGFSPSRGNICQ